MLCQLVRQNECYFNWRAQIGYKYIFVNFLKITIYRSDKVKIIKIQIIMRNAPVILMGFPLYLINKKYTKLKSSLSGINVWKCIIFCLLPNHANFSFANLQQYYLKVGVGMKTSNKPHTRKGKNIKIVISTFMPLFWWGTIEWYAELTNIQTYTDGKCQLINILKF